MYTAVLIIFIISCLLLIASILLQSSKSAGMGGSIGGTEQIFGAGKARSLDRIFDKVTKISAFVFIVAALVLVALK